MDQIKDGNENPIWEVHLTLMGDNDKEMGELTRHVRKEMSSSTGWFRLGQILIKYRRIWKSRATLPGASRQCFFFRYGACSLPQSTWSSVLQHGRVLESTFILRKRFGN